MSEANRHIGVEQESGVLVLSVNETNMADYDSCAAIGRELVDAVTKADNRAVVIDLRNVEFIASMGVVPFLSVNRCVRQKQGRLVLCNLSDFVKSVFTTTRLLINPGSQSSPFEWTLTRAEAIDMLRG